MNKERVFQFIANELNKVKVTCCACSTQHFYNIDFGRYLTVQHNAKEEILYVLTSWDLRVKISTEFGISANNTKTIIREFIANETQISLFLDYSLTRFNTYLIL